MTFLLVLSREVGYSVHIKGDGRTCVLTVLKINSESKIVQILVNLADEEFPGELWTRYFEPALGTKIRFGQDSIVTVVDIQEDKIRLGFEVPRDSSLHRLELLNDMRWPIDDSDAEGGSTAPVPRPKSPQPPLLDIRLDFPRNEDEPDQLS